MTHQIKSLMSVVRLVLMKPSGKMCVCAYVQVKQLITAPEGALKLFKSMVKFNYLVLFCNFFF